MKRKYSMRTLLIAVTERVNGFETTAVRNSCRAVAVGDAVRPLGRWVDPDFPCEGQGPRWVPDETFRMRGAGGAEHRLPGSQYRAGLAVVDCGGRQQAQTPVVMLVIVPMEEGAAEVQAMVEAREALGELRPGFT